jgi:hypothetical protein
MKIKMRNRKNGSAEQRRAERVPLRKCRRRATERGIYNNRRCFWLRPPPVCTGPLLRSGGSMVVRGVRAAVVVERGRRSPATSARRSASQPCARSGCAVSRPGLAVEEAKIGRGSSARWPPRHGKPVHGKPVHWPQDVVRRAAMALRECGSSDIFTAARAVLDAAVRSENDLIELLSPERAATSALPLRTDVVGVAGHVG